MAKEKNAESGSKRAVSRSLQETVATHPNIDYVHFDMDGNHHFNVHEHKGGKDEEGGLYARIHVQHVKDKDNREFKITTPILKTKIVESLSREQILAAQAESDILVTGLKDLTPAELKVISKMRQGNNAE